ncbi:hypothetical protein [Sandaracinobacteroides hominis]|uniref:hypothetical protein n=1 Tax=Sandaracinobacteroides hominis TaxID=2780086 RepID=UPI0018F57C55|nr:hypothetical protein [Sandaracinobacteroides hominis]
MSRLPLPLLALALLAGCATTPAAVVQAPPPPPPGMEQLLGQPAETATKLLGTPRLDRREGPARQLQFTGGCVLDVYYYPGVGTVPVATHADSRLADGRDFAPGECLQMLINARKVAVTPVPPAPAPPRKPVRKRS